MSTLSTAPPRLESDLTRNPRLGYESTAHPGFIRCIEHGFPTPLAHWHYHEEYELQLIVATRGRAFVGDYIGDFEPGHLVLTGPRLPHNWISVDDGSAAPDLSRLVIQFRDEPLRQGMQVFPELAELSALLERARYGIEFFGMSEAARRHFHRIRNAGGVRRFAAFTELLGDLARCQDYRLLSRAGIDGRHSDPSADRLHKVIEYVSGHYAKPVDMAQLYALTGMSASTFSRAFSRVTGGTFTSFLNRYRVSKACELLMHTSQYIAQIGYDVGFNNLANFNRRFVEVKGMTPSEFRRRAALRHGEAEGARGDASAR